MQKHERIFISYSRRDQGFANELFQHLNRIYRNDIWIDNRLLPGVIFWPDILFAIQNCNVFICIVSRHWVDSPFCQAEFKEAQRCRKKIIPVVVRSITTRIPQALKRINYIDMRKGDVIKKFIDLFIAINDSIGRKTRPCLSTEATPFPELRKITLTKREWFALIGTLLLTLFSLSCSPPPPQCVFASFYVTNSNGDVLIVQDHFSTTPGSILLIASNVVGCNYTPRWHTASGNFLNIPTGGITYIVPDQAIDIITITLPENVGDEQAQITVQIDTP